jgi:DNA-binding response OmpR family regulator
MGQVVRRSVLVVDDDPVLHRDMISLLGAMGFDVLGAFHYEEAVQHLAARKPHLVCVDVGLPTQSGYELCEYIRKTLGLTTVPILMTGDSGSPEDMANAEEAGANAFLKKPFSMRQLTNYVEALVDRERRARRSEPYMHRLLV